MAESWESRVSFVTSAWFWDVENIDSFWKMCGLEEKSEGVWRNFQIGCCLVLSAGCFYLFVDVCGCLGAPKNKSAKGKPEQNPVLSRALYNSTDFFCWPPPIAVEPAGVPSPSWLCAPRSPRLGCGSGRATPCYAAPSPAEDAKKMAVWGK